MNELHPIEHQGQRVLTTLQLAESFDTDSKIITNNYGRNKVRYTHGKHYFELRGQALDEFKGSHQIDANLKFAPVIYLWTEKGAWLHAKSLNTDRAWEAYEMLVDDYYRVKEGTSLDVSQLSPEMQMFKFTFDAVAKIQLEAAQTKQELVGLQSTVTTIKETFLQRDDNWRQKITGLLNGAATRLGGHREVRTESYRLLEERAHCKLNTRLANLKDRLAEQGATKTKINDANRLDVIESDPRLKEIYTTIVKELAIGTMA